MDHFQYDFYFCVQLLKKKNQTFVSQLMVRTDFPSTSMSFKEVWLRGGGKEETAKEAGVE